MNEANYNNEDQMDIPVGNTSGGPSGINKDENDGDDGDITGPMVEA